MLHSTVDIAINRSFFATETRKPQRNTSAIIFVSMANLFVLLVLVNDKCYFSQ